MAMSDVSPKSTHLNQIIHGLCSDLHSELFRHGLEATTGVSPVLEEGGGMEPLHQSLHLTGQRSKVRGQRSGVKVSQVAGSEARNVVP